MEPVYHSTERATPEGYTETVGFSRGLFMGLAPDGGLLTPVAFPVLPPAVWESLRDLDYPGAAETVLWPFVSESIDRDRFRALLQDAYDFPLPLEELGADRWLLRLDQGPTASFKDFAARWMARMMHALRPADRPLRIIVATSGDTGSAVGDAFRGLSNTKVFLLFPAKEVSPVQRRQLISLGEHTEAMEIEGTFDDCQRMAKQALHDPALSGLGLSSANSISIGRVLPQMVYYAWAWSRVARRAGEPVAFCVPSGNFGNALACEWARQMGLPVAHLILAVNANDSLPRYMETGRFEPVRPSRNCLSNAMNVGHPNNLPRFIELFGGILDRTGRMVRDPDRDALRRRISSISISDEQTVDTLRRAWEERHLLLEPHGAVGYAALQQVARPAGEPAVMLETAHPAKFPEAIEDALGFTPEPPPALQALDQRPSHCTPMPGDYEALRQHLESFQ